MRLGIRVQLLLAFGSLLVLSCLPLLFAAASLPRLIALYTGVVALALLLLAYLATTRLVVQPIDQLSHAARRVADGALRLETPRRGARELVDLGASLELMTARLRADEEAMRAKIVEVERYAADLRRAQEELVRSARLASVGRLAAGLAHEIGNPIAALLGFHEILHQGGLTPDEQHDFLERMRRETERVHHVLRAMLDFSRPVAGEGSSIEPPGDVGEAVAEVLSLVTVQRAFRGVEASADLAPRLPRVTLSHQRLVQVLLNLLLNAADAVPEGRGRIIVRAALAEGGDMQIEVEDNGPGVAPEIRSRLFEPFATTKEVGRGTGLGLAVCRGLVEAVMGSLTEEAGQEGGARFVVRLPVPK